MKHLKDRQNKLSRNLLIAFALGDGCISRVGQMKTNHSWKQYKYVLWKMKLLNSYGIKTGKLTRLVTKNGYLKYTIQYRFNVEVTMFTKLLRRVMYSGSTKLYKRKLLNRLDAQGLALWFMDDGSLLRRKYKGVYKGFYLRISTYCSSEQADEIINYFKEVWDIHPTKICEHRKNNLYTINFGAKEGKKLIDIIKPHMCPEMMYKILYDVEECKRYYNVTNVDEIYTKCTSEEDRLLMEAHANQKSS